MEAIGLTSTHGWRTLATELPDDFEELAKEHKGLEVHYGDATITSASDLLRPVLLHAGADLGLRQPVAVVAESSGPASAMGRCSKKMRLSAPPVSVRGLATGAGRGGAGGAVGRRYEV